MPEHIAARLLVWLIRLLPRNLAIKLGLRRLTPGRRRPSGIVEVPGDTGGAWRPDYRMQSPSKDPKEPYGSESNSTGENHAWANCTMAAGAMGYAYNVHDQSGPWGGDMRHNQDDREGGTDLYDLETAWKRYGGQDLKIKTGQGWSKVKELHPNYAIVIQGEGNVPGSESFDGGHACIIAPETNSDGKWLFGDPLATGWQWVSESSIRDWAENWHSGIAFAVGKDVVPEPEPPEPEPEPEPPKPKPPVPTPISVDPVAWNPAAFTPYYWGVALWGDLCHAYALWHIPSAQWPIGWVDAVPIWDTTEWAGGWG